MFLTVNRTGVPVEISHRYDFTNYEVIGNDMPHNKSFNVSLRYMTWSFKRPSEKLKMQNREFIYMIDRPDIIIDDRSIYELAGTSFESLMDSLENRWGNYHTDLYYSMIKDVCNSAKKYFKHPLSHKVNSEMSYFGIKLNHLNLNLKREEELIFTPFILKDYVRGILYGAQDVFGIYKCY